FSDDNGWADRRYLTTLRFADVDGDGRADICGRGSHEIQCFLAGAEGGGFPPSARYAGGLTAFSDDNGWGASSYASTVQLADINGDGKADICGRGSGGLRCFLANADGSGLSVLARYAGTLVAFSDVGGWSDVARDSTIHLVDLDGDGNKDVCGRGPTEMSCFLSGPSGIGPR